LGVGQRPHPLAKASALVRLPVAGLPPACYQSATTLSPIQRDLDRREATVSPCLSYCRTFLTFGPEVLKILVSAVQFRPWPPHWYPRGIQESPQARVARVFHVRAKAVLRRARGRTSEPPRAPSTARPRGRGPPLEGARRAVGDRRPPRSPRRARPHLAVRRQATEARCRAGSRADHGDIRLEPGLPVGVPAQALAGDPELLSQVPDRPGTVDTLPPGRGQARRALE
jgi:hypothetical protein